MKIEEIEAKSIIVKSKLPDTDYVINPYTGCQFGCLYCYATFMGRFVNESRADWGNYVYVKKNAIDLARSQIRTWSEERKKSTLLLSSVTDPYHGIENKYCLTRGILEVLVEEKYPGTVSILTKSPLVLRDLDLLSQLNAEVGLTITTTDDTLSRFLEVSAPTASRRLKTLFELVEAGIKTYVFIGPLLPHFRYEPELLENLFKQIADSGTKQIYVEHINLPTYIKERMWKEFRKESEEVQNIYKGANTQEHRDVLTEIVRELAKKYDLTIRLDGTIYHQELKNKKENIQTAEHEGDVRYLVDEAISKSGVLKIKYRDFYGSITERDIAPYEWTDFDKRKVKAFCYKRQDDRTFSLLNIEKAEYLGKVDDYDKN